MGKKSLVVGLIGLMVLGCKKNMVQGLPAKILYSDTTANLYIQLANSSLHVFNAAMQKAGLDSLLKDSTPLTIFAPTDSAFARVGITLNTLPNFSADTLARLLRYHITLGDFGDDNLSTAVGNVPLTCLLTGYSYDPVAGYSTYFYNLFVTKSQALYIDGSPVNSGANAEHASNGYLYSIDSVLIPPTQTIWQILQSRPELSMYYTACTLDDSVYMSQFNSPVDSPLFMTLSYNTPNQPHPLTLLAPVNAAFTSSPYPLHTVDQLRYYADSIGDPNTYPAPTALDQIVLNHVVGNQQYELFYNDLLQIPGINDGSRNLTLSINTDPNTYNPINYYVQFMPLANPVTIRWGSTTPSGPFPSGPAQLLPAGRNIVALNGVIHEVDSVLLP